MSLLDRINKENDIKTIPQEDYPMLAREIRRFLVESVSRKGGHLASNLGAVELTIALHAVMNFPQDKIIWDVGHQSYTHKILTGRKDGFKNLREFDGLSGFPKRNESPCDCFDTGHSSTSISAALGIATAHSLAHDTGKVVAVIGDGALTSGMALEALNNAAALKRNLVIILNDNEMSISKNVGGMSNYLNKFRVGEHYNDFKEDVEKSLSKIPKFGKGLVKSVKKTKDSLKNIILPGGLFDDLGITYIGPVDGHDIDSLIDIFSDALKIEHPILIHVKTKKGKGYSHAERNPSKFHGIGAFNKKTGEEVETSKKPSYTDVFADKLVEMATNDKRIVAITAAMPDGTGLSRFQKQFPKRFFDVGIAEEHAVTFAAGLATQGMKPFVSIYSSFYQRAYDQILHDVCLQNLPVVFIVDRAGLVGKDGETHQGIFDISFLSAMPNMTVIAPKDDEELKAAMEFANMHSGPVAIRFARGSAWHMIDDGNETIIEGKSEILIQGEDIALVAVGNMVEETYKAVQILNKNGVNPTLVNAKFLKPIDTDLIGKLAQNHKRILIVEEGIKRGGYGEAVASYITENNLNTKTNIMAIDDMFVKQGSVSDLRKYIGISAEDIYKKVIELEQ
jgi:1-deoxy-D-xylulose-5-phosphate synthase